MRNTYGVDLLFKDTGSIEVPLVVYKAVLGHLESTLKALQNVIDFYHLEQKPVPFSGGTVPIQKLVDDSKALYTTAVDKSGIDDTALFVNGNLYTKNQNRK